MKRGVVLIVGLLVLAVIPCTASAQGWLLPGPLSLGGNGWGDLEGMTVVPKVRVGYENLGMNLNIPIDPRVNLNWILERDGIDVRLKDAKLWVGMVGADVVIGNRLGASLSAWANAQRGVDVDMPENPFGNWNISIFTENPLSWRGTKLQTWALDGRISYDLRGDVGVIGGLRYDRVTLGLRDPADSFAQLSALPNRFTGDIDTTLWIPYFGAKWGAPTYRASFILSPLTFARVRVPLVFVTPVVVPDSQESNTYRIDKPGWFLEFEGEYGINLGNRLGMKAWMVANWLHVRGNGNMDHTKVGGGGFGPLADKQSGNASLNRYLLAFGAQMDLSF